MKMIYAGLAIFFASAVLAAVLTQGCGGSNLPPNKPLVFECEASGETFTVAQADLEDEETFAMYQVPYGEAVVCKVDGNKDAYRVYYCAVEKKYYRYQPGDEKKNSLKCPNGHPIAGEDL